MSREYPALKYSRSQKTTQWWWHPGSFLPF